MTTTAREDQFTDAPEPVRQTYSTADILRRNVANAEKEMQRQAERAESYAETLRSLASYVGAGGYNADTVDAGVFEEKIRWGIGEIMKRMEKVEVELVKLRGQKPVRWHVRGNYFHDGDAAILFASMNAVHGANVEQLYAAPVPAPAVPEEWRAVMQEAHDTFQRYADLHRAKDTRDSHEKAKVNQKLANKLYALLQSAEVTDNAAADRLLEGGE